LSSSCFKGTVDVAGGGGGGVVVVGTVSVATTFSFFFLNLKTKEYKVGTF
jgi:hypothetical protein